jgi:hypothetical protein
MQLSQKAPDMVDLQMLQFDSPREIQQYPEIVGITFASEGRQSPRGGEVSEIGGGEFGLPLSGHLAGTIQTG